MDTFGRDEVGDPSDWPSHCLPLRPLDSSLRCELCFDIFRAPVALKACGHTFCSTCIRTHINQPGAAGSFCPKCRQSKAYDSELMPMPALEATAEAWRNARKTVMALVTAAPPSQAEPRKRKDDTEEHGRRRSKRVRPGTSADTALVLSEDEALVVQQAEDDDEYTPAEDKKLEVGDSVDCPICSHTFTMLALNAHLDKGTCFPGCPEPSPSERGVKAAATNSWFSKATPSSSSSSSQPNPKRLHRPQYNLKSERDLRKLLESQHLPNGGDKERLAERHRQWVNLYNANLDAAPQHRKNDTKLRKELAEWERSHSRPAAATAGLSEKKAKTWLKENREQYSDLIAKAKQTAMRDRELRNKKPQDGKAEEEEAEGEAAPPLPLPSSVQ